MHKWLLVLLICLPWQLLAQDKDVMFIEGHLYSLEHKALAYAHIIIPNQHIGTISDTSGKFVLPLKYGDTIMISHMGYMTRFIYFTKNTYIYNNTLEIILLPNTFELKEVVIRPFPKDWDEFKEVFTNLKLQDEPQVNMDMAKMGVRQYVRPENGFGVTAMGPVQAIYNLFSKDAKKQELLAKLKQNDKVEKRARVRYNEQLISRLTGISDKETIIRFMKYCKLDNTYILALSDYELYLAILDCYKSFGQCSNNQ